MNDIKLQGIDIDGIEKEYSLNDFKGQKVILYFYPKDNTSGCTQEACDFRDNINRLTSFATVIVFLHRFRQSWRMQSSYHSYSVSDTE